MSSAQLPRLAGTDHPADRIRGAIATGAQATGTDFTYLLAQARLESGLNPGAKASTSSASGLFQFIDSTWLATLARHGRAHGYGHLAEQIEQNGGRHFVRDPAVRAEILRLRHDPTVASVMAGALAQDNCDALTPVLGRAPDGAEMYLAHFLGIGGAAKFLRALNDDHAGSAADLLPEAARANRAIFFADGAPRSLAGVMDLLRGRLERAMGAGPTTDLPASMVPTSPPAWATWSATPPARANHWVQATDKGAATSMSRLLETSFAAATPSFGGDAVPAHVRAAYDKLRAFAL